MAKLLVETPQGSQELIEVDEGGGYFEPSRVTWDERKDGPFPAAMLPEVGGLIRSGKSLAVDSEKKAAHEAKKQAESAKEQARAERKARIKSHDANAAVNLAAMRPILADLLAEIRGE